MASDGSSAAAAQPGTTWIRAPHAGQKTRPAGKRSRAGHGGEVVELHGKLITQTIPKIRAGELWSLSDQDLVRALGV